MRVLLPVRVAGTLASTAAACDTALRLAVDVSGSISMGDYHLQMDGLAEALLDPAIIDALAPATTASPWCNGPATGSSSLPCLGSSSLRRTR